MIEDDLKRGRLPCVVATSSLELGIDMGAVDLVIQIESPPSVASALQRVGRAGHQVGEISRGVLFPKHRGDLVPTAVAVERMRSGGIEALSVPANPLDVLAQQVVAATAMDTWAVDDLFAVVRRSAPFAGLPRSAYDATLDLLAGRYPSDEFAELRPRIVWDRVTGELTARPGAQRLAVTSGGTIPDRGMFGVFLVGERRLAGRRARRGDGLRVARRRRVHARHHELADRGHHPRPGAGLPRARPAGAAAVLEGRHPRPSRRAGGGRRRLHPRDRRDVPARRTRPCHGRRPRRVGRRQPGRPRRGAARGDQRGPAATPQLVVERFRDELGDWRIVVHSPYGAPVHAPWALAINARLRERYGMDAQAMAADDGIVLRIPETDQDPPGADLIAFEPDEIEQIVTTEVGGSALFASRFRECAARALLLPRRDPGRRSPLWQQRQTSCPAARGRRQVPVLPDHPRDGPRGAPGRLRRARADRAAPAGAASARCSSSTSPRSRRRRSPGRCCSATSPRSCTRATPRSPSAGPPRSRSTRGCSPSCSAGPSCASCSTPRCWPRSSPSCSGWPTTARRATPRAWSTCSGCSVRCRPRRSGRGARHPTRWSTGCRCSPRPAAWSRSGWPVPSAGRSSRTSPGSATGSASRCPRARPTRSPSRSTTRWATWSPGSPARTARSSAAEVATRLGLGVAVAHQTLVRLAASGRVLEGEFRPAGSGAEWCDAEVLRRLRRRSLARLRHEVEPVEPATLGAVPARLAARGPRRARPPGACGASTAWSPWSSSSPGAPYPPARWSRWCCRRGWSTTHPRCSTS